MTRSMKPTRRLSGNGKGKSLLSSTAGSSLVRLKPVLKQSRGNVQVAVRIRPPTEKESCSSAVVKAVSESQLVFDPKEEEDGFFFHGVKQTGFRDLNKKVNRNAVFAFDNVFPASSTNQEVFELTTKPAVRSVLDGQNCSVFAYGATGAGKTYTMLGTDDTPGIVYLTVTELWNQMEDFQHLRKYEVAVSYLEIYNELVKDLLQPGEPLSLREDPAAGVVVHGLSFHMLQSSDQLFDLLKSGNEKRTQHPTDANKESSRSHAVFQVWMKRRDVNTQAVISVSKLSLIDLAGSERGCATGHSGDRFKEGTNINKSLLALGNCISALAEGRAHIPFRDSKLTRILKDSLGGNCQTVMIAAASPSHVQYEDTYNTLKYADRAKKIKASFVKKVLSPYDLKIAHLEAEVESGRSKIEELDAKIRKLESGDATAAPASSKEEIQTSKKALKRLYKVRQDARLEVLKLQSIEREIRCRMSNRREILKRCMQISIGAHSDQVTIKERKLGEVMHRKVEACQVKMAELMSRLTAADQKIAEYQERLNSVFAQKIPEEVKMFEKLLQAETRIAEMNEKVCHLDKIVGIREQAANEDQDQILTCLDRIQNYYLLMRSGGLISQYQEFDFEKFVASLERDVGIMWEDDLKSLDKDMTRISVGVVAAPEPQATPCVTVNGNPADINVNGDLVANGHTSTELDDTNVSTATSPMPARFAAVNDSFAIRKDVRPVVLATEPVADNSAIRKDVLPVVLATEPAADSSAIRKDVRPVVPATEPVANSFAIRKDVRPIVLTTEPVADSFTIRKDVRPVVLATEPVADRSVGEAEFAVPVAFVGETTTRPSVSLESRVVPANAGETHNRTLTLVEPEFEESAAEGSLNATVVVHAAPTDLDSTMVIRSDSTVVLPFPRRDAHFPIVLPVIDPVISPGSDSIPCRRPGSETFKRPIVPVRTAKPDSAEASSQPGRPFRTKDPQPIPSRGLNRVPSSVSRSTSSLLKLKSLPEGPTVSPQTLRGRPGVETSSQSSLFSQRGKSVSTSRLNKM